MATGGMTVSGLTSGIDFNSLISQLIQVDRSNRIRPLENKKEQYQARLDAMTEFKGLLESLQSASESLNSLDAVRPHAATSSDTDVVTATAGGDAISGTYQIKVDTLAQAEVIRGDAGTSGTNAAGVTFDIDVNGTTKTVTVTNASTTIDQLASNINSDAGDIVTAYVVTDGAGQKTIYIQTDNTGVNEDITFTVASDTGALLVEIGLVTAQFSAPVDEKNSVQAQLDAQVQIGGASGPIYDFSSNTITTLVPGVTLELQSTDAAFKTITVSNDTTALKENIQEFVDAYNAVASFMDEQNDYDEETETGGALMGDLSMRFVESRLSSIVANAIKPLDDSYEMLSQIGIELKRTGLLEIDEGELNDALSDNFEAVGDLFMGYRVSSDNFDGGADAFDDGAYTFDMTVNGMTTGINVTVNVLDTNNDVLTSIAAAINNSSAKAVATVETTSDGNYKFLAITGEDVLLDYQISLEDTGVPPVLEGILLQAGVLTDSDADNLGDEIKNKGPSGIAAAISSELDDFLDPYDPGIIASAESGYQDILEGIRDDIEDQEARILKIENRYRERFTALEVLLSQFQAQGDFLSQHLSQYR